MSDVLRWLQCALRGHRWSGWFECRRIDQWTNGVNAATLTTNATFGWMRMCSNYHAEWRGIDWEQAPHGVITVGRE